MHTRLLDMQVCKVCADRVCMCVCVCVCTTHNAGEPNSAIPAGRLVEAEELVVADPLSVSGSCTAYRGPVRLTRVTRPAGRNECGMVAWVLTLRTPECPQVRAMHVCVCASCVVPVVVSHHHLIVLQMIVCSTAIQSELSYARIYWAMQA